MGKPDFLMDDLGGKSPIFRNTHMGAECFSGVFSSKIMEGKSWFRIDMYTQTLQGCQISAPGSVFGG